MNIFNTILNRLKSVETTLGRVEQLDEILTAVEGVASRLMSYNARITNNKKAINVLTARIEYLESFNAELCEVAATEAEAEAAEALTTNPPEAPLEEVA